MTLATLPELLTRFELSRATYYKLMNRGLLPHYAERTGRSRRNGAVYLYDVEAFEKAWAAYQESQRRGLGIDYVAKKQAAADAKAQQSAMEERRGRLLAMAAPALADFILENVPPNDTESLMEYDERIARQRTELLAGDPEKLKGSALELLAQGAMPRSWR